MSVVVRALMDADFDETYYCTGCGRPYADDEVWRAFFGRIADGISNALRPRTVLDAGCAWGLLVAELRSRGIDARGFDISSYAMTRLPPEARGFCQQRSVTDEIDGRYDLIVCIEVLPHLLTESGKVAVANFCRHADAVLFSCAAVDPAEPRHLSAEPPEFWDAVFDANGFRRDRRFHASFVTPWARLYRRRGGVTRLLRALRRRP